MSKRIWRERGGGERRRREWRRGNWEFDRFRQRKRRGFVVLEKDICLDYIYVLAAYSFVKTFRDKRTCIQICNASTVQHCLLFIPIFLIINAQFF